MEYTKEVLAEMAGELGQAIKLSREYIEYQAVKTVFEADKDLQEAIGKFNLEKMAVMNEMQKEDGERDDDKMKEHQNAMREAYSVVTNNAMYAKYTEAKNALETMVNNLYAVINYHVTGKEPGGCSGSCDTCGGCH